MARMRAELDAPVLIGVGAAFDFHAGLVPQAPNRVQDLGLEWAYRLAHEPRRLWRRYARYNPRFVAGFMPSARRPLRSPARQVTATNRRTVAKLTNMTTKEKLRAQLEQLSEQEAQHAQIVVGRPEPDVVGLPKGWGETLTGEPMPNVVAAVRRVRDEH
jgi:hypothetical protein